MTMSDRDIIRFLESFDKVLGQWFDGDYQEKEKAMLRKKINQLVPQTQQFVFDADCYKSITATPPPVIGGPVLQNVNPFDMIFESYYGHSVIPTLRDMTQQAIGVYRSGKPKKASKQDQNSKTSPKLLKSEKITIYWLFKHVPIKLWLAAIGLLIAIFIAGIEASELTLIKELKELFGL